MEHKKSFYGKAVVEIDNAGNETLYSYNTPIIKRLASGELVKLWGDTTGKHIKAFCGLNKAGFMGLNMNQHHRKKRRRIAAHFTDNRMEEKKMKVKTTRKAIVNGSYNVKCAGYCDLSYLLNNHSPIACTCGVYGWNFDVYEVYGVTICTGYRNMPGARLQKISEYEEKARAILSWEDKRPFEEKQIAVENLLKEFCKLNGGVIYE